ncbi:DUF1310 family protein [Streptococcus cristatus]|uniref:DUF1310 family protein n=1 Tax=Streptococcus cristatus TaxID=45634 RepID=A0A139MZD6_STRCR|nr:DUF1310 family protein [Streptococcus cristatus]KXT69110.1 hypothetical protein SCRDD08_01538 [Streptococcus cristatus]
MKKLSYILGILGIIIFIGGCSINKQTQDEKLKEEMLRVVKSEEVKKMSEEAIKNIDDKAFTDDGIIKSYKIDYDSVSRNPMGGIQFNVIINNNPKLKIFGGVDKNSDGALESHFGGYSADLDQSLEELK